MTVALTRWAGALTRRRGHARPSAPAARHRPDTSDFSLSHGPGPDRLGDGIRYRRLLVLADDVNTELGQYEGRALRGIGFRHMTVLIGEARTSATVMSRAPALFTAHVTSSSLPALTIAVISFAALVPPSGCRARIAASSRRRTRSAVQLSVA